MKNTAADKIWSYCIDDLPEKFDEALLKKANLTMKEIKDVMKKLKLI